MKKLYIHIGARKAGSTSIQKFLANNSDWLSGYGIRYISASRGEKSQGDAYFAHHRAARVARFGRKYWDEILGEIDRSENVNTFVVSSELFYNLDPEYVGMIKDYTHDMDVRIVFIKRDKCAFLKSEYKQQIKISNEDGSFSSFCQRNGHLADFEIYENVWRQAFGGDRIHVLHFENYIESSAGNLIGDVLEILGCPDGGQYKEKHNVSVEDDRYMTLRCINKIANICGVGRSRPVKIIKNSIVRKRTPGNLAHGAVTLFLSARLFDGDDVLIDGRPCRG